MRNIDANSGSARLTPAVLIDFDDTAAEQNVAGLLLERFGDPSWQEVRERFRGGELTLKEYQEITFRNILADRAVMQDYVKEHANLRPYFHEVWSYCSMHHLPMAIVSQGLDFYIQALLDKEGLNQVKVYSVNTKFTPEGITYQYYHTLPGHEREGNSKGLVVDSYKERGHYIIYAGDGTSDLEAAPKADLLFAHRTLAEECRRQEIPFRPFKDFQTVLLALREVHRDSHHSTPDVESLPKVGDDPQGGEEVLQ
ncbi:MAG: hypothetical protein BZY88_02135 [SAR202 cluster bacterium Io17-Chloro-G9]|nr:MAG: hypothetical protein BZY88_02135 [SAR202 cluster bacterium Io17-Chloro-G9]